MNRANVMARAVMMKGDQFDHNGALSMVEVETNLLGSNYHDFARHSEDESHPNCNPLIIILRPYHPDCNWRWLIQRRANNFRRFDTHKVGALKLPQLEKACRHCLEMEVTLTLTLTLTLIGWKACRHYLEMEGPRLEKAAELDKAYQLERERLKKEKSRELDEKFRQAMFPSQGELDDPEVDSPVVIPFQKLPWNKASSHQLRGGVDLGRLAPGGGLEVKQSEVEKRGSRLSQRRKRPTEGEHWDKIRDNAHFSHVGRQIGFDTEGKIEIGCDQSHAGALHTQGFEDYNWGDTPPTRQRPASQARPATQMTARPSNLHEVAESFMMDAMDERSARGCHTDENNEKDDSGKTKQGRRAATSTGGEKKTGQIIPRRGNVRLKNGDSERDSRGEVFLPGESEGIQAMVINILSIAHGAQAKQQHSDNNKDRLTVRRLTQLLAGTEYAPFGDWWSMDVSARSGGTVASVDTQSVGRDDLENALRGYLQLRPAFRGGPGGFVGFGQGDSDMLRRFQELGPIDHTSRPASREISTAPLQGIHSSVSEQNKENTRLSPTPHTLNSPSVMPSPKPGTAPALSPVEQGGNGRQVGGSRKIVLSTPTLGRSTPPPGANGSHLTGSGRDSPMLEEAFPPPGRHMATRGSIFGTMSEGVRDEHAELVRPNVGDGASVGVSYAFACFEFFAYSSRQCPSCSV